jgi:thiol-disulfide isomerase/thioredoxin
VGFPAICATLFAVLAVSGCGGQATSAAPSRATIATAFRGSPPALADLHAQANRLLGGGPPAFAARLAALARRGYPVVVNEWASWCGPCRFEFPAYQRAAVVYGRRAAFIGLDAKDADPAAAAFLRRYPVTYPSYVDPTGSIAAAIHAYTVYPQTFYFDRHGTMVYDKAGPYASASALEQDIRRYLLGAG